MITTHPPLSVMKTCHFTCTLWHINILSPFIAAGLPSPSGVMKEMMKDEGRRCTYHSTAIYTHIYPHKQGIRNDSVTMSVKVWDWGINTDGFTRHRRGTDGSMRCVTPKHKTWWERRLIPSCHFSAHIVSIIQIGSVGSIMAMAIFPKQMAPVEEEDAEQTNWLFFFPSKRDAWLESEQQILHLCLTVLPQECFYFLSWGLLILLLLLLLFKSYQLQLLCMDPSSASTKASPSDSKMDKEKKMSMPDACK